MMDQRDVLFVVISFPPQGREIETYSTTAAEAPARWAELKLRYPKAWIRQATVTHMVMGNALRPRTTRAIERAHGYTITHKEDK